MKIATFLHDLRGGGAERVAINLANTFSALGHQSSLVMLNKVGPYLEKVSDSVATTELTQSRTLTAVFGFRDYLNKARPDAVVCHMTHINVAALMARRWAKWHPPMICVEHNQMSRKLESKRPVSLKIAHRMARSLYARETQIAGVSSGVCEDLSKTFSIPLKHLEVLYNPVVGPCLAEQGQMGINSEHSAFFERPVILGVGRLTRQKNFKLLIEAFNLVRESGVSANLLILGEGELRDELDHLIAKSQYSSDIHLPGFVENPYAYMTRSAVFALSSDWEGLPTVLIEAMAIGTAIVSTNCVSGPSEILMNGTLAPLHPCGDVRSFSQGLIQALQNRQNTKLLEERANDFSYHSAAIAYLDCFERLSKAT